MSKYEHARAAISGACAAADEDGLSHEDMLLALIVAAVDEYRTVAGPEAAAAALTYELGELEGKIDTQFIRSR